MYIHNAREYRQAKRRYSRLFDKVEAATGRWSYEAIHEALTPAEIDEFNTIDNALAAYDRQQAFYACLRSGDYRS